MIYNQKTKTYPLFLHAAGLKDPIENYHKINLIWPLFKKIKISKSFSKPKNLEILTFNSKEEETILENNLKNLNIDFTVLGKGINPWINKNKISCALDFLKKEKSEYTAGLDANDVILINDISNIIQLFEKYECDLLFGAELIFWPDCGIDEIKKFEENISSGCFRFLNSGTWIGKTKKCIELFEEANNFKSNSVIKEKKINYHVPLKNSDQFIWHFLYKKYYPKIKTDNLCEIFQNSAYCKKETLQIRNKFFI